MCGWSRLGLLSCRRAEALLTAGRAAHAPPYSRVVGVRVAALALVSAVVLAAPASADVGVELLTTSARRGAIVRINVFAPPRMPLYLVTASRALQPHRCHGDAICAPSSIGPPNHWPYVRLRPLSPRSSFIMRAGVPARLRPGRYRAVLYCESCYRGPRGSLVISGNTLVVR